MPPHPKSIHELTVKIRTADPANSCPPESIIKDTQSATLPITGRYLKTYYWEKWKLFVAVARNKNESQKFLQQKIDSFLQRIKKGNEQEERRLYENNTRVNSLKTSSQNLERMGREKYAKDDKPLMKISKGIAESAAETKRQLRNESISNLSPSLKGKAKLIRLIATGENEPLSSTNIPLAPPVILKEMDEKHYQRRQRLKDIQYRKRLLEEEKDRIAKENYERSLLEAELEKKRKVREFREKQRREQLEMEKQKREWARMKELNEKAINHYNRTLMAKYAFYPWLKLLRHRQDLLIQADNFNERRMKQMAFRGWRGIHKQIEEEKINKALVLRTRQLLRFAFNEWLAAYLRCKLEWKYVEDWSLMRIVKLSFRAWKDFVTMEKLDIIEKRKQAEDHERRKLLGKCLQHWMLLPQILYLEREKQYRLSQWREKVQQVLPDFRGIATSNFVFLEHKENCLTSTAGK